MKDPYNEIAEIAVAGEDRYTTMIVRIRADGIEFNEILEFDGDTVSWCWLSDWYEGQRSIEYLGSIRLSEVRPVVRGKWKKILQNADGTSDYECSVCLGLVIDVPDDDEHPLCSFCPNCGADMREEKS